jgi:hypothetical protein
MTDENIPSISTAMDTLTDMHVKAILCEMNLVKVNSSNEIVITSRDKMMDIQMHLETASYKVIVTGSRYTNNTTKSFYVCKQILPAAINHQARKRRRHTQSLVFDPSYLESIILKLKNKLNLQRDFDSGSEESDNEDCPTKESRKGCKNTMIMKSINLPSTIDHRSRLLCS